MWPHYSAVGWQETLKDDQTSNQKRGKEDLTKNRLKNASKDGNRFTPGPELIPYCKNLLLNPEAYLLPAVEKNPI